MKNKQVQSIKLSEIVTNDFNPRKHFNEDDLYELAESITQQGVLQAIILRPKGEQLEIVCGERRYRAAMLANLTTIPAFVRELSDEQA